jgi:hypothetical protein
MVLGDRQHVLPGPVLDLADVVLGDVGSGHFRLGLDDPGSVLEHALELSLFLLIDEEETDADRDDRRGGHQHDKSRTELHLA